MCEPQKVQYSILERDIVRIGNFIKQYFETRKGDTELCYFILYINDTVVFHLNECSLYRIVCATVNLYPEPFHSMVL